MLAEWEQIEASPALPCQCGFIVLQADMNYMNALRLQVHDRWRHI